MAVAARVLSDVTEELSRAVESGDAKAVAGLLLRVEDLNARNRHGTTLLMKAACYGDAEIVRLLLVHGADPNVTRNDKFTALALAAFFGHAETVKTLLEFGARTEVVTRSGASAHTWATARTFSDVARCLDTPTLKPAQTAIQQRGSSSRARILPLGMVAAFVVIVCCGFGVLILRSLEAHDLPPVALQPEPPTPKPIVVEVSAEPEPEPITENVKKVSPPQRKTKSIRVEVEKPVEAPAEKVQISAAPPVAKPKFDPPKPATLSPEIMAPTKKARVIQWP